MRLKTTLLLVTTVFCGCVSIPPETPELSVVLGQRIAAIRDANVTLLHRYFDLKRSEVDRFILESWAPTFAKTLFDDPDVEREWQAIVESDDAELRVEFLLDVAPAMQDRINSKRVELTKPLDELEFQILQVLETEYNEALSINATITSFLASASAVAENRNRFLKVLGVNDKRVATVLDGVGGSVTEMLGNVEDLEKGASDFVKNIRAIGTVFSEN